MPDAAVLVPVRSPRVARALPAVTLTAEVAADDVEAMTSRLVVVSKDTVTFLPAATSVASALICV